MKKTLIIVGSIIVGLALLVGGYFLIDDMNQKNTLKKEIIKVSELDVTKDEFPTNIVSKGDYGKVEKTIKDFLSEYSKRTQETLAILYDTRLTNVLTIENYEQDGKEFVETKQYLSETKATLEENFAYLVENSKMENMEKLIDKENLSKKYIDLYNELMFKNINVEELDDSVASLEESREGLFNMLNIYIEVIDFLVANKDSWYIEDELIVFTTNETLTKYNELVSKLQ